MAPDSRSPRRTDGANDALMAPADQTTVSDRRSAMPTMARTSASMSVHPTSATSAPKSKIEPLRPWTSSRSEHAAERLDERVGDAQDQGHDRVVLVGGQEQQHDPKDDQDLEDTRTAASRGGGRSSSRMDQRRPWSWSSGARRAPSGRLRRARRRGVGTSWRSSQVRPTHGGRVRTVGATHRNPGYEGAVRRHSAVTDRLRTARMGENGPRARAWEG